jgi:hypothetical protein
VKHLSLIRKFVNYVCKRFYKIGHWSLSHETFGSKFNHDRFERETISLLSTICLLKRDSLLKRVRKFTPTIFMSLTLAKVSIVATVPL